MNAAAPTLSGFRGAAAGGWRGDGAKGLAGTHHITVVTAIVLAHAAGLWALFGHALRPAVSAPARPVVTVMVLAAAPAAVAAPQPAPPPAQPKPRVTPPAPPKPRPTPPPTEPEAISVPATVAEPVPAAPSPPTNDAASAMSSVAALPEAASAPAPAAAAKLAAAPGVTRQIHAVEYLRAPVLEYPSASRRFREQGRVVLRVLVGADGQAVRIELVEPSAFERLNDAAIEAARRALYKPHTEDGVAQPAWALVALSFQLKR